MVKEELIKIRPNFLFYQNVLSFMQVLRDRVNVLVTGPPAELSIVYTSMKRDY